MVELAPPPGHRPAPCRQRQERPSFGAGERGRRGAAEGSEAQVIGRGQAVQVGADDLTGPPSLRPAVRGFAGLLRRPASRWARVALVAVNLAVVAAFLVSYSRHGVGFGPYRIDLGVYRMGGRTWLHGGDLYRQVLVTGALRLPFTYPPVAAGAPAPLALLPMTPA